MMNTEGTVAILDRVSEIVELDVTAEKEVVYVIQDAMESYTRCMELDEAFMEALLFSDITAEEIDEMEEIDDADRKEIDTQNDIRKLLLKHPDFLSSIESDYKLTAIQFWNYDFRICTEKERKSAVWVQMTYRNCDNEMCLYQNASPSLAVQHLTNARHDGMPMLTDEILEVTVGGESVVVKDFYEFVRIHGIPEEE